MISYRSIFFLLAVLCSIHVTAQEFDLSVTVTIPALQNADPADLQTLESAITEFYNDTRWTDDDYEDEERIQGSIQINIKSDPSTNNFVADFYVNVGRPVYNSNYTSPIINHVDKDVRFTYEALTPIRDNRSVFTDNLSAVLTYYAYIILGYDGDTFAPLGGEDHFRLANQIVNLVPANTSANWTRTGGDRTRFFIIENMLDPRMRRYRQAMYEYHRNGLDRMHDDLSTGKAIMLSAIKEVGEAANAYRNSMIIQMWGNAKRQEILEIFKNSVKSEQRQVYDIMAFIDAAQADQLRELR